MDVVHSRCCGLDVHKRTVVACVLHSTSGPAAKTVRTFGTMTDELLALADWLQVRVHAGRDGSHRCRLETDLQPARGPLRAAAGQRPPHQGVPGRKTDVKDCEWIADLLRHGLLEPSFVPSGRSASCAS